ncbi:SMP-30/gluconolactonase/LRE family protein [Microbacterium sp. QXD-8]|uniref:SMP-30/gluconolactonase/LRE family protein n=1 Tax=Microbacterium psychrotolerans TaxID=3068321 RepID=A0ABU0YWH4_9MICO|nr:SMP-30/gluconolactonase/LRE family protein [Microbacterium sp. QXD-8]MDQ7876664.1 SMP-30/gluconolactonase/LRE family protein [Microbacterium sp. QXD-8]
MRIPTRVTVLDDRMRGIRTDANLAVHYSAGRWLEGPSYSAQGRYLLFSDIPNDLTLRLDEMSGAVVVFDHPSHFANGRTHDRVGRVVTCLHGERSVVRREHDGRDVVLASTYQGRRLNSPNDVVVSASEDVWFTDPTYGIVSDYEGHQADAEQESRGLYRWTEGATEPVLVSGGFSQPNGLAFSLDERELYVVDSERDSISALTLDDGGHLVAERVLVASPSGFDGIRIDAAGRIWAATREGVSCFDSDGHELLRIAVPEPVSNLEFGGRARNVLFMTATSSLYSVRTSVRAPAAGRPGGAGAAQALPAPPTPSA